jgi:hypothetical protein
VKKLALSLLSVIGIVVLIAAPVLAAGYTYTMTLTETGGNTYTNYPFIATMDNSALITGGYLSSTGMDALMKDGAALPTMVCTDKTLFVDNLPANHGSTIQFTTGNTPMTIMPIIVGNGGHIISSDIYPMCNILELKGYFNLTNSATYFSAIVSSYSIVIARASATSITATFDDGSITKIVTAAGLSSGDHTLKVDASGTNILIYWDGALKDTSSGNINMNFPNPHVYTWMASTGMPYADYLKLSVGATEIVKYQLTSIFSGTTLFDLDSAGGTLNATITFGSNPAGIGITLGNFAPTTPSQLTSGGGYGTITPGTIVSGSIIAPPQLYTELDTSKIPLGAAVQSLLTAGDVPAALWWFPFIYLGIVIIGMLVYDMTQRTGGQGSLLAMSITILVLQVIFGVLGNVGVSGMIPLWSAILFIIPAGALIMSRRHVGWG